MTLSDLRDYMQACRSASLLEIATHFEADPSAVQAMLERWIAKGRMRFIPMPKACCCGCTGCSGQSRGHYEWITDLGNDSHQKG